MAQVHSISAKLNVSPPLPPQGLKAALSFSPVPLLRTGFNMLVSVSMASSVRESNPDKPYKTVTVMGHFDTGASKTSIDVSLADYIGLTAIGVFPVNTAGGLVQMPNYAVDISFPNTKLSPFINLPVSSCKLPFKIDDSGSIAVIPQNFGLLIGRDIMSRWNVVWNGPTSTVFVSD